MKSSELGQLSSFAQALLLYSYLVSRRYFPERPHRVLPVRVIVAYFSFADVVFHDDSRREMTWQNINTELKDHLTLHARDSFPEMSDALSAVVASIDPDLLERRLHSVIEENLTLRYAGFLAVDLTSEPDPILVAFAEHLSLDIPDSKLCDAGAFGADLLLRAETEMWHALPAKLRYIEFVASMLGLDPMRPIFNGKLPCSQEYSTAVILGESNIRFLFTCVSTEADLVSQGKRLASLDANYELVIFVLVVLGNEESDIAALRRVLPRTLMVVTVYPRDVLRHTLGYETHVLGHSVRDQLPLSVISPYRTSGATARDTFVGRRKELDRVLQSHDIHFAILGPRKIGKTSLMEQLRRTLNGPEADNTIAVDVDAGAYSRLEPFLERLHQEFFSQISTYGWFNSTSSDYSSDVFKVLNDDLQAVKRHGFNVVFLIDEIDRLLESRDSMALASCVRSLANRQKARFVVFGYTELAEAVSDGTSAFFNLFSTIRLGPIDQPSAIELATLPMNSIGVHYSNERVATQVVSECCNIPWLIQGLCNEMLAKANRGESLSKELVDSALESEGFSDLLLLTILKDRSLPDLQLLIMYIVAGSPRGSMPELDIYHAVQNLAYGVPFKDVSAAVSHLVATYRFQKTTMGFRFYVERQRSRLLQTTDFREVLQEIGEGVSAKFG